MPKSDPFAEIFGVATIEEHIGDSRAQRVASDLDALGRKLHALPPLNGRPPITKDDFGPDPEFVDTAADPNAPTIPELQQRHREWSDLVHRGADAQPAQRHSPERATAERLWSEFGARHPDLTGDPKAVERAATKIAQATGFDPDNRAAFYDAVAAELEAPDDGRTAMVSPTRSSGGAAAPRRFSEADSRAALDDDIRNATKGWQH